MDMITYGREREREREWRIGLVWLSWAETQIGPYGPLVGRRGEESILGFGIL